MIRHYSQYATYSEKYEIIEDIIINIMHKFILADSGWHVVHIFQQRSSKLQLFNAISLNFCLWTICDYEVMQMHKTENLKA